MGTQRRLWAVVLTGGEGTRLAPLTERLYGERLPKRFGVLAGDRSLLQATIERLLPLVPASRMVIVVPLPYEGVARAQLAEYAGIQIVAQPANRGTGPGVLLPLPHVLEGDPEAQVVVTPSDHYISDSDAFTAAIASAAAVDSAALTLVGAEPDGPETEYGWIEAAELLEGNVRRIGRFVEKPAAARARELFARGGLWNTFVLAARARRLWEMAEERMPAQAALIQACVAQSGPKGCCLACAYEQMEEANFSRTVLESAEGLGVVSARGLRLLGLGLARACPRILARHAGAGPAPLTLKREEPAGADIQPAQQTIGWNRRRRHAPGRIATMRTKKQGNGGPQTKPGADAPAGEYRAAASARLAYDKWQARGCPDGDDKRNWLEAEQELLAAAGSQPRATVAASSGNRT